MSFNYVNNRILTSNEPFLVLSPTTVKIVGRSAAIVLQQLHYWISSPAPYGNVEEDKRWIYNTYEEWQSQIKVFSTKTIQRAFKKLGDSGLVLSKRMNKKASDQTKSYTIDYEKLGELTGINESKSIKTQDKMSSPSGQNGSIIIKNTKRTTEKTYFTERDEKNQNEKEYSTPIKTDTIAINIHEEMLSIWNAAIEENKNQLSLDPLRTRFLKKAFTDSFQSDMNQWREYCNKIASSKFLMGEVNQFKASLDWCLKFETIHRIKEGAYNQVTRTAAKDLVRSSSESIETDLNKMMEHESAGAIDIRKKIIKKIGNDLYKSWFEESRIVMKEGSGTIFVANRFRSDRLQTQFGGVLEALFLDVNISSDYASLKESEIKDESDFLSAPVEEVFETFEECIPSEKDLQTPFYENISNVEFTNLAKLPIEFSGDIDVENDDSLHVSLKKRCLNGGDKESSSPHETAKDNIRAYVKSAKNGIYKYKAYVGGGEDIHSFRMKGNYNSKVSNAHSVFH